MLRFFKKLLESTHTYIHIHACTHTFTLSHTHTHLWAIDAVIRSRKMFKQTSDFPIFHQFLFPIYMGKSTQTHICRAVCYEIRLMSFPYVLRSSPQYLRLPPYCVTGSSDGVSATVLALPVLTLPALKKLSANPMIAF